MYSFCQAARYQGCDDALNSISIVTVVVVVRRPCRNQERQLPFACRRERFVRHIINMIGPQAWHTNNFKALYDFSCNVVQHMLSDLKTLPSEEKLFCTDDEEKSVNDRRFIHSLLDKNTIQALSAYTSDATSLSGSHPALRC